MTATCAIIPASGLGKRLSSSVEKAFVKVAGRPLVIHTLQVFDDCPEIDEIVLVVSRERIPFAESLVSEYGIRKVRAVVAGGSTRQESVRCGLAAASDCEIAAIHDAARPFVTRQIIASSIAAAIADGAAIAAVPVVDTIKTSPGGEYVGTTLDRRELFAVQTPQTFAKELIVRAYDQAAADGYEGTDDASLVERLGVSVRIVSGSYSNVKITTPADLAAMEAIMEKAQPPVRVGHGYDIHRFAGGRRLFLGGVEFPGEEGLLGHSDADVLLHAVADALLGAAGAGDIGRHFPDTDSAYKDARSTDLLARVVEVVGDLGWQVGNVDVTLIGERPKIAKRVPEMQSVIAGVLGVSEGAVSIKATTAEGLGAIGEGQGIECHAVTILYRT